jgi:hypothetical protein
VRSVKKDRLCSRKLGLASKQQFSASKENLHPRTLYHLMTAIINDRYIIHCMVLQLD